MKLIISHLFIALSSFIVVATKANDGPTMAPVLVVNECIFHQVDARACVEDNDCKGVCSSEDDCCHDALSCEACTEKFTAYSKCNLELLMERTEVDENCLTYNSCSSCEVPEKEMSGEKDKEDIPDNNKDAIIADTNNSAANGLSTLFVTSMVSGAAVLLTVFS